MVLLVLLDLRINIKTTIARSSNRPATEITITTMNCHVVKAPTFASLLEKTVFSS
jgi:hypothetical protein